MTYTISELAKLAAISTRTLRHYDEIGLLQPNHRNNAGYRIYQRQQLLVLQQILLYRELGFPLNEIQEILQSHHFDIISSLNKQKNSLKQELSRIRNMVSTIEETINHIIDDTPLDDLKLFLSMKSKPSQNARNYLQRAMDSGSEVILQNQQAATENISKDELKQHQKDTDTLCDAFVELIKSETPTEDAATQKWAKWYFNRRLKTLDKQLSRDELIQFITADINHPKARRQFDAVHPEFADYFLSAMTVFLTRKK
mgnify:CR=1 FL=1